MRSFHDNVLSMINPRNFVLLMLVIIVLEEIICIFISLCFFVKNCKKCVLSQFNVNKLLWNQLIVSIKTKLILLLNSSGLVFDIIVLISSAKNIGLAILFMGNTEPGGTVFPFRRYFIKLNIFHCDSLMSIFKI